MWCTTSENTRSIQRASRVASNGCGNNRKRHGPEQSNNNNNIFIAWYDAIYQIERTLRATLYRTTPREPEHYTEHNDVLNVPSTYQRRKQPKHFPNGFSPIFAVSLQIKGCTLASMQTNRKCVLLLFTAFWRWGCVSCPCWNCDKGENIQYLLISWRFLFFGFHHKKKQPTKSSAMPLSVVWFELSRSTSTLYCVYQSRIVEYLSRCFFIVDVYISFSVPKDGRKYVRFKQIVWMRMRMRAIQIFQLFIFCPVNTLPSSQASPVFAPNSCDLSFGYLLMALHFLSTHATDSHTHTQLYASCARTAERMNEWGNAGDPEVLSLIQTLYILWVLSGQRHRSIYLTFVDVIWFVCKSSTNRRRPTGHHFNMALAILGIEWVQSQKSCGWGDWKSWYFFVYF